MYKSIVVHELTFGYNRATNPVFIFYGRFY